jgi:hypothetical protein
MKAAPGAGIVGGVSSTSPYSPRAERRGGRRTQRPTSNAARGPEGLADPAINLGVFNNISNDHVGKRDAHNIYCCNDTDNIDRGSSIFLRMGGRWVTQSLGLRHA